MRAAPLVVVIVPVPNATSPFDHRSTASGKGRSVQHGHDGVERPSLQAVDQRVNKIEDDYNDDKRDCQDVVESEQMSFHAAYLSTLT